MLWFPSVLCIAGKKVCVCVSSYWPRDARYFLTTVNWLFHCNSVRRRMCLTSSASQQPYLNTATVYIRDTLHQHMTSLIFYSTALIPDL